MPRTDVCVADRSLEAPHDNQGLKPSAEICSAVTKPGAYTPGRALRCPADGIRCTGNRVLNTLAQGSGCFDCLVGSRVECLACAARRFAREFFNSLGSLAFLRRRTLLLRALLCPGDAFQHRFFRVIDEAAFCPGALLLLAHYRT